MPSQLRLRPNTPSLQHGNGLHHSNHNTAAPNPQHQALPLQQLHPPPAMSPSKYTRPPVRFLLSKIRIKFSTFFVLGSIFAVGSIQRLHFLALHYDSAAGARHSEQRKNEPPDLRLRTLRRLGRHPKVVDVSYLSASSQRGGGSGSSFIFGTFPFFRTRPITTINDPMLHHDGWQPSEKDNAHIDDGETEEEAAQCVPMAAWQTTSYPNCNSVHEIDLVRSSGAGSYVLPARDAARDATRERRKLGAYPPVLRAQQHRLQRKWPDEKRKKRAKLNARGIAQEAELEFLGQGWFRAAWEMSVEGIPEYDEEEETFRFDESVVLKTLRIEREFLEEYYELHRRDALAMERLTFSPYVLNIHGYCGQSAINELANFGIEGMSSLEKVARSFRGMEHIEPVSKIKLQLAARVATGVSHLHSIDYPDFPESASEDSSDDAEGSGRKKVMERVNSNATLVHYDLNPRNIAIVKHGRPKLNDFNVAEFLTWNVSSGGTCGFKGRFREPWWRAPEEMRPRPTALTEKIDIYALGNVLWDILTTHSPRGKMQKDLADEMRHLVARGELPTWPSDFNQTKLITDPALRAIEQAMMQCLRVRPEDRPTAGEVAYELNEAIDNLPEGYGDKEEWKEKMRQGRQKHP